MFYERNLILSCFPYPVATKKKGKIRRLTYALLRATETPGRAKLQEHNDELVLEQSLKLHTVTTMYKLYELQERK